MQKGIEKLEVSRWQDGKWSKDRDEVVREEPLEIRLGQPGKIETPKTISITMRTPGADVDLALGFLFSEGIVGHYEQVVAVKRPIARKSEEEVGNIIDVWITSDVPLVWANVERHFYTASSCGVCGKSSVDMVMQQSVYLLPKGEPKISVEAIGEWPEKLRGQQRLFSRTGGVHAAGLVSPGGDLIGVFEDVGRHNALDKLIGYAWQNGMLPLGGYSVVVSGRLSFELVQKSWMAGLPILVAVGAPSSLAIELARSCGMTLAGFVRKDRINIYHDWGRVVG